MSTRRQRFDNRQKATTAQQAEFTKHPIQNRYYIRWELNRMSPHYKIYEGIDCMDKKLVTIYLKPEESIYSFSKKTKEGLRLTISPSIKWSGFYRLQKKVYCVQVQQKYGPSLRTLFSYIKHPIAEKDFLILMYQLIRLVQKFASIGYVHRELGLDNIVFDASPEKTDMFLLNVFGLKKRGDQLPAINTRFCSRAAHLGLKSSFKDDLESICYILLDIFTEGEFLTNSPIRYFQTKSHLDLNLIAGLPEIFKSFYLYTINLNYGDDLHYFQWRNQLYKLIGKNSLARPYGWMIATQLINDVSIQSCSSQSLNEVQEDIEDELKSSDIRNLRSLTSKILKRKEMKENQPV